MSMAMAMSIPMHISMPLSVRVQFHKINMWLKYAHRSMQNSTCYAISLYITLTGNK